jgi:endonuclease III related protein
MLMAAYRRLRRSHGHAGWWPGETPFVVCLGAILTQNTAWTNVEKALAELRSRGLLTFEALSLLRSEQLAPLIRPAGYFNVKARRLAEFLAFLGREYDGRVEGMRAERPGRLREKLLAVHGIGPETADSIALYAADQPVFVVDAYTRRIGARLGWIAGSEPYDAIQAWFMERLPPDVPLFNDYHAQIVLLGKDVCRPQPRCGACPLRLHCPRRGVRRGKPNGAPRGRSSQPTTRVRRPALVRRGRP